MSGRRVGPMPPVDLMDAVAVASWAASVRGKVEALRALVTDATTRKLHRVHSRRHLRRNMTRHLRKIVVLLDALAPVCLVSEAKGAEEALEALTRDIVAPVAPVARVPATLDAAVVAVQDAAEAIARALRNLASPDENGIRRAVTALHDAAEANDHALAALKVDGDTAR